MRFVFLCDLFLWKKWYVIFIPTLLFYLCIKITTFEFYFLDRIISDCAMKAIERQVGLWTKSHSPKTKTCLFQAGNQFGTLVALMTIERLGFLTLRREVCKIVWHSGEIMAQPILSKFALHRLSIIKLHDKNPKCLPKYDDCKKQHFLVLLSLFSILSGPQVIPMLQNA